MSQEWPTLRRNRQLNISQLAARPQEYAVLPIHRQRPPSGAGTRAKRYNHLICVHVKLEGHPLLLRRAQLNSVGKLRDGLAFKQHPFRPDASESQLIAMHAVCFAQKE